MGATHAEPTGGTDTPDPNQEGNTLSSETLTEDELFELLSNRRRRYILHELMRADCRLDIGSLSQEIAACEDEVDLQEVSSSDRKRVYTALHQSHLPKMDKAGVIDFDQDRGTVEPTPALENIEIYMDVVRGREIPWSDYYLGLTAIAGLVVAASTLDIGPFAALPSSAWGVFLIVTFGVSAIAHRYYARRNRLGIAGDPPASDIELEYHESNSPGRTQ
ncbi:DUF7344 domain-containing protein [Natronolimnobius baerhuensis]|uniref:DUF7344 domain-containing protein n=1 Tax=Natronolimnobius baerhuensis TaxID=253108 RepID=A0A202EA43_9EURY|nr:hypothetical protein [Natronolimnobius baerhuensis]OVE85028.1 hypothetical protein B2G88_11795 [Natronolimnobius baerhuensis]